MSDIHSFEPLWGEWRCIDLLGQGSYGKVYLAEKTELGKHYYSAIKHIGIPADIHQTEDLYSEGVVTDELTVHKYYEQLLQSLMAEININYRLKGNANIVSYEEHKIVPRSGEPGYDIFIKMELLTSLANYIRKHSLTVGDVVRLGCDICTALTVLCQERIVHRDIKPANIFLHSSGHFKLGDFGVARTLEKTVSNMSVKGTFAFMAPEVARGGEGDYRVDIYSLGLVLYKLLNGNRNPFLPPPPASVTYESNNEAQRRRMQGEPLPAPCRADPSLSDIILKACAYRPEDRYQNAQEFRQALDAYAASMTLETAGTVVLNPGAGGAQSETAGGTVETDATRRPQSAGMERASALAEGDGGEGDETVFLPHDGGAGEDTVFLPQDGGAGEDTVFLPQDGEEETVFLSQESDGDEETVFLPQPEGAEDLAPPPDGSEVEEGTVFLREERETQPEKRPSRRTVPLIAAAAGVAAVVIGLALVSGGRDESPVVVSAAPVQTSAPLASPVASVPVLITDSGVAEGVAQALGLEPGEAITAELLAQVETLRIGSESGFTVTSLEDLAFLPNLKVLDVSGQQIGDWTPLTKAEGLTGLNLGGCALDGGAFLEALPQTLENLDLRDTGLTTVSFAGRLWKLRYLNISGNQVTDLSPLSGLSELATLAADGNPVVNWTVVDGVPSVSGRPAPAASPSPTPRPTPSSRPYTEVKTTPQPTPAPSVSTPQPTPQVQVVSVTGLSLSQSSAILDVGGSLSLTATVSPSNASDRTVRWSTSNGAVASVSSGGRVTAVGPGTAVITASCGGVSASCTVSVS